MANNPEIMIIGGGAIGICSAYYLAQGGRQVTVIDKGAMGSGASYGNAGFIIPGHLIPLAAPGALAQGLKWMLDAESPFYIKPRLSRDLIRWTWQFRAASNEKTMRAALPLQRQLGFGSADLYHELIARERLDCHYTQAGLLMLYRTEHGFEEAQAEARLLQEFDVPLRLLDGPAAAEMDPAVSPEIAGGIYFSRDAHLDPALFMQALAKRVEEMGVTLRPDTEVLDYEVAGGKVTTVRTTRGDFHPGQIVLAAGAWSPDVARALSLRLPVQPAKGYSITVKQPDGGPRLPMLLGETRVAVTPLGPNLRYAGTLELAGMDFSINQRRVNAILNGARSFLVSPVETDNLVEIWRGQRPCTPNGLPIIGRPASLSNLIVATGHATSGISLAPITGSLVAQIATGQPTEIDITVLNPDRFS